MATLYFNAAVNNLWSDVLNWWTDAGCTIRGTVGAAGDIVTATASITEAGRDARCANLTMSAGTLSVVLTVTGMATFNGASKNNGTIYGPATFNGTSENNVTTGYVEGATIFNTSAKNYGAVVGGTTFNNASTNESGGFIQGACILNSTAQNKAGAVITGATTMNSCSVNAGTINGYTQMHTSSSVTSVGIINGSLDMDGSSTMAGTMTGSGLSVDSATISAGGISNCTTALISGGTISGILNCTTAAFSSAGTISSTGVMNISGEGSFYNTDNSGVINGAGTILFTQYSNNYGTVNCSYAKFENFSENKATPTVGTVNCNVDFIDQCYNRSAVNAEHVLFNDSSANTGTVTSNDCKIYAAGGNNTGTIIGVGNFYGAIDTGHFSNNTGGIVTGTLNAYQPATYPIGGTVTGSINYIGYNFVKAAAALAFSGSVNLGVANNRLIGPLVGGLSLRGSVKVKIAQSVPPLMCKLALAGTVKVTLTDTGFTVKQGLAAITTLWGGGCSDGCENSDTPRGRAAFDILNGCMQEIILNAKELQYLSRAEITLLTPLTDAGLTYFDVPDTVQTVVGPVRLLSVATNAAAITRYPTAVQTRGQLLNFSSYYQKRGGSALYAYWVDRSKQSTGDRTRMRVYISPSIPAGETSPTIKMDVETEALRYRSADCVGGTVISLPHQYAESLLLPLLREAAASAPYASRRDSAPMYKDAAAAARARFGLADPQNPLHEPEPERKRKP